MMKLKTASRRNTTAGLVAYRLQKPFIIILHTAMRLVFACQRRATFLRIARRAKVALLPFAAQQSSAVCCDTRAQNRIANAGYVLFDPVPPLSFSSRNSRVMPNWNKSDRPGFELTTKFPRAKGRTTTTAALASLVGFILALIQNCNCPCR